MESYARLIEGCDLLRKELMAKNNPPIPKVEYPNTEKVDILQKAVYSPTKNTLELECIEREYYKKIDGYKTINGVKHKILSDVLLKKEKNVTLKFSCSMNDMKDLYHSEDFLVRQNADLIYVLLKNVLVMPSALQNRIFDYYHKQIAEKLKKEQANALAKPEARLNQVENELLRLDDTITSCDKMILQMQKKVLKLQKKKAKVGFKKDPILRFFTFGLISKRRKIKKLDSECDLQFITTNASLKKQNEAKLAYVKLEKEQYTLSCKIQKIKAHYKYLEGIEKSHHGCDFKNVSEPFKESFMVKEPVEVVPTDEIFQSKYPASDSESGNEGLETLPLERLTKLYERYPVTVAYAILANDNQIYAGISFDFGKTLSVFQSHELLANEVSLYRIAVIHREELFKEYKNLLIQYNATFLYEK